MDERYQRWEAVLKLREGLRDDSVRVAGTPVSIGQKPTRARGTGGLRGSERTGPNAAAVSLDGAAWRAHANCLGEDTAIFFPQRGESVLPAKAICTDCTVAVECLDYAIRNGEHHGYWNSSERHRRRLRHQSLNNQPTLMRRKIVEMRASGMKAAAIAEQLNITRQSVYSHLANDKRANAS